MVVVTKFTNVKIFGFYNLFFKLIFVVLYWNFFSQRFDVATTWNDLSCVELVAGLTNKSVRDDDVRHVTV